MNRDSAFPSALEGWGRSAGSGHPCTSSGYRLGKKAIHSIENFSRGAGRMHVPTQFSAVSHPVSKITGELLHSSNRIGPFGIDQIPEIGGKQLVPVPLARLVVGTRRGELGNLAENPGIVRCGASDHHGVASGFAQ